MGELKLITSLILIGLFTLAVIGFATNFAIDNDVPSELRITSNPYLSELNENVSSELYSLSDSSNNTYEGIKGSEITTGDIIPTPKAFFLAPVHAVSSLLAILKVIYIEIFGSDASFSVFLTSFVTLITLAIAFFIWQTWKGGSP